MNSIFLDSNSTTLIDSDVIQAIHDCYRLGIANPASQHELGRQARVLLEEAKEKIAQLLDLHKKDRVVLTSGGTESNNLAIFGCFPTEISGKPSNENTPLNLVISAIEHPSVLMAANELARRGVEVREVQPSINGTVSAEDFRDKIDSQTRLVSCMAGNNETGVIQPVSEIASICHEKQVPFHVDAVQAIGKQPFSFQELGATFVSISAHKIHGPVGSGALLINQHATIQPILHGGFQQGGIRPGTESVASAVGFRVAIEKSILNLESNRARLEELRNQLESGLLAIDSSIQVVGEQQNRLPHCSNIAFVGLDRQQFLLAADMEKVAVSTGSACSSGSSQPSHVLTAMNLPKSVIQSSIRFGVSLHHTSVEIDDAIRRIHRIYSRLRPVK